MADAYRAWKDGIYIYCYPVEGRTPIKNWAIKMQDNGLRVEEGLMKWFNCKVIWKWKPVAVSNEKREHKDVTQDMYNAVWELFSEGHKQKVIAKLLSIPPRTVSTIINVENKKFIPWEKERNLTGIS